MLNELFSVEKMLSFCEKVWYFLIANLLFVFSNIPVLLFLLFVGISQVRECLPLFLLCMLPMAPALSAMMYVMNRLVHGTEGKVFRDYWKGYKRDYLQKLKLGGGQLFLILVLWTNIEFFTIQTYILPLAILFIVLFAVTLLITPNLYLLISRYEMNNIQIVKTALTLLIARPIATLGSVAALGIVLVAYELVAGTTVLFMGSIYTFLIVFMNQSVMSRLEENA